MVLYVGADGNLVDGPLPAGTTEKVVALVGGTYQEVFVVSNPSGGGGSPSEVGREKIQYDLPEAVPPPTVSQGLQFGVSEAIPAPEEFVVAGLLARAEEVVPAPEDGSTVLASTGDSAIVPTPDESAALALVDSVAIPSAIDTHGAALIVAEVVPAPVAIETVTPSVADVIVVPLVDEYKAVGIGSTEPVAPAAEAVTLSAVATVWPDATVSNTGFSTPANLIDKSDTTAATISATSSGLANTTSNTSNGTIVVSAVAPTLSDLTTISSVVLRVKTNTYNSGALSGQAVNMALDYSLNDGASWANLATITGMELDVIRTLDITALVGNDWSKINQFRFRATGSVTSGIGVAVLASTTNFQIFMARLEVAAERSY